MLSNDLRKVLITGSKGLVGSAIVPLNDEILLTPPKANVNFLSSQDTLEYLSIYKPDAVIHCAAKVGGLLNNMNNQATFYYENMMMTTNLIEQCRIVGVKKILSFLSTCIFPDRATYPLTEDQILNGDPHPSNYGYAYAKRMTYIQSKAYRQQYNFNAVCVAPTNIYGINDNFDLQKGHVIPSLIHKCYIAKLMNTDFEVWGSGNPLREFIYSSDVGKLAMMLLRDYNEEEPIILTTGQEHSIGDIAKMIAKSMNFKGNIKFNTSKPDGQFRKPSSNAKLKKLYPDFNYTPIEEGIYKTVEWFCKNYPNVRK